MCGSWGLFPCLTHEPPFCPRVCLSMDVVDDVLIVGVERDCDCLCLGEDKASKQKRLGEKGNKTTSWKGKEPANPSRRTVGRKTTLLSSVRSSKLTEQIATVKDSTTKQGQAGGSETSDAMQFHRPADHGNLAMLPLSQPVARGASTSGGAAFASQQTAQSLAGLTAIQESSGTVPMMVDTSSGNLEAFLDFNADWWDSVLGEDTSSPHTDGQKLPSSSSFSSSSSSSSTSQEANAKGQDSAMTICSSQTGGYSTNSTPSFSALASTSAGCNSWTGQNSLDSVSSSALAPVMSSATAVVSPSGFTNYEVTEKDSATRPVHYSTISSLPAHVLNSNPNPSFSALNQNQASTSSHPLPSTPSSLSPCYSSPSSTSANQPGGHIQIQPPSNSQVQQGDNTSPPVTLPNQYQSPIASQVSLVQEQQQQQQQQPAASCLPGQLAPASMSHMAISQMSTPINSMDGTSAPRYPRFASQQEFSGNVRGPIAALSQQHTVLPQLSYNGSPAAALGREHLHNDENLARKLQEEEFIKGMRRSRHIDERLAMSLLASDLAIGPARNSVPDFAPTHLNGQHFQQQSIVQMSASPNSSTHATNTNVISVPGNTDNTVIHSNANNLLGAEQQSRGQIDDVDGGSSITKHPTCWTKCPNCPADVARKYHLIDVELGSPEWDTVSKPLVEAGFSVVRLQRIQNETLWQRLCFEKQLMLRDRPHCNQRFLYHTSRAEVSVICEEGLDPRLSRNGLFGSGIYFR